METRKQSRGEFIPIISGGIHTSWYNRVLNIMPTVLNNDTTTNSSISSVCMYAKVKVREKHRFSPVFVNFAAYLLFVYISN